MNSDMVKPEKLGHLHLVYDFTVPLNPECYQNEIWLNTSVVSDKHF